MAENPQAGGLPFLFEHAGVRHSQSDVARALAQVGVGRGDRVLVHSDLMSFGRPPVGAPRNLFCEGFLTPLLEAVGPEGTLLMPTFSYSFCKGADFDPNSTPSTVGMLTEYFRSRPGVFRSRDPLFSVAALGSEKAHFTEVGTDCFGVGSVFETLRRRSGRLLFLGETFDITFMHHVETVVRVPYRRNKRFHGRTLEDGRWVPAFADYSVRPLDGSVEYDFAKIEALIARAGVLRRAPLGASQLRSVGAEEAFMAIAAGLAKDPKALLTEASDATGAGFGTP